METYEPRIKKVVEDDMCIACGACLYACPPNAIEPFYNVLKGAHEVRLRNTDACVNCSAPCETVCPSIEINYESLLQKYGDTANPKFNKQESIHNVYLGYSIAYRQDQVSSSGGILRAIIKHSLKNSIKVICLAQEEGDYGPKIIDDLKDISLIPGSIYHSVSFHRCIELIRSLDGPCHLVSTPCQLEGVIKYIDTCEPNLIHKIGLKVGLICGWMFNDHSLKAFASYKNIEQDPTHVTYRGGDPVGQLKFKVGGVERAYRRRYFDSIQEHVDYNAAFSNEFIRSRCRVCRNHLNILADIAVGDAWLQRKKGQKMSLVLTRSALGEALILGMAEQGEIIIENGSLADIVESQTPGLVYGHTAKRLNRYLAKKKTTAPRFYFGSVCDDATSRPRWWDRYIFDLEMYLKRKIYSGKYAEYRFLYFIKNIKSLTGHFLRIQCKKLNRLHGNNSGQ
jgi:coenzyme F420 hydrogenase subunit beta